MRAARLLVLLSFITACQDSDYYDMVGPSSPRLTAVLVADAPGSSTYTARILVADPRVSEYVGAVISGGATASFAGGDEAAAFCTSATREQTYEIRSALGVPRLVVKLGIWQLALDAGAPPNDCADTAGFHVLESLVVIVPSAANEGNVPGVDLDAGSLLDGSLGEPGQRPEASVDAGIDIIEMDGEL